MPGVQHRAHRVGLPQLPTPRDLPPPVEFSGDLTRAGPLQTPSIDPPDNHCFVLDDAHRVPGIPIRAFPRHVRPPVPGPVLQSVPQPPRGVIRGAAGMRHLDPQKKPIIRIRQITTIRLPMQRNIMLLRQRQEFLQIPRLTHQPIRVIHNHMPHPTHPDRLEQCVPPGTLPGPLPGRPVVVHQHRTRGDHQSPPLRHLTTQSILTIHPRLILIPSIRNPAIDRRRFPHPPRRPTLLTTSPGPVPPLTLCTGHVPECMNKP